MTWIRVAVGIGDDPDIHLLAERLSVSVAEAVGLMVGILAKCPEHAPTGDLQAIPDTLLERWSGWGGKRGKMAPEFRAIFLDADGIWPAWGKHNGKPLEKAERDRDRKRTEREADAEWRASIARTARAGRSDGAGTDGRTDVRSTSTDWRKRPETANGVAASTPASAFAPLFCTACTPHPVTTASGRITGLAHADDCPTLTGETR